MTFSIFPMMEGRLMPIDFYTIIQREFWLPFAVLFFALASHLVPSRYRRSILIIVVILVLVAAQQASWRLGTPEMYNYKGKILKGVCRQTSYETCGAASMVTLLNSKGIITTEGEMARLSMTASRLGLSPHGAAYGLKRKLGQLGLSDDVIIKVPEFKNIHKLPTPFLAGIKFSSLTNHLVCVLDATKEYLVIGDPISIGPQRWSWESFNKRWSGIVIVCN
jgi:predicted double-glycine peptidase